MTVTLCSYTMVQVTFKQKKKKEEHKVGGDNNSSRHSASIPRRSGLLYALHQRPLLVTLSHRRPSKLLSQAHEIRADIMDTSWFTCR